MLKNQSKILLIIYILLAILSASAVFYNTVILHNFTIENDLEEDLEAL